MRTYRGFTLIELLVSIAIIALLIGLLLPALARARQTARATAGLAKLRDLSQATRYYADDNHDEVQRTSHSAGFGGLSWYQSLARYFNPSLDTWSPFNIDQTAWAHAVNQHYRSPNDPAEQLPGQIDARNRPILSYAQSVWFELRRGEYEIGSADRREPFRKLDSLPHASRTVLFAELTRPYLDSLGNRATEGPFARGTATDHIMAHFWKVLNVAPEEVLTPASGPPGGYAYADGHASLKRFEETFSVSEKRDLWDPRGIGIKQSP